jgi:hypothetical protein
MPPKGARGRVSVRSTRSGLVAEQSQGESSEGAHSTLDTADSASHTGSIASTLQTRETTTTRRSRTTIAPRDVDFRDSVLEPRGIIIKGNTISLPDPYTHFA